MTRHKVVANQRNWRCQICDYANLRGKKNFPSAFALALHIAEEWTRPHEDWRVEHGLPKRCETLLEAKRVAQQIMPFIQSWHR